MTKQHKLLIGVTVSTAIFLLMMLTGACTRKHGKEESNVEPVDSVQRTVKYGLDLTDYLVTEAAIPSGAIFGSLMSGAGVPPNVLHEMVTLADTVFDLRKLRAGNRCTYVHNRDSLNTLRWFVYHVNMIDYVLFDFQSPMSITTGKRPVDTVRHTYAGIITSSLWNAMVGDGKNPELILSLSDIFAWVIDFYGIQKEDKFKVIYDELLVDDQPVGVGIIHAAWFEHVGQGYYAFRYEQDSVMQYFDTSGVSLRREFLKAPLEFRRISSHFSHSRLHPILRRYRPHHGVDYAAASGTPVRSIGDGTVLEARYAGGAGHMVKIRHNSTYTTVSMHLRGYGPGIRPGSKVKQGQVIGYVGSTGLSTGPHLDFRVYKNGTPINPLKLESPPAKPVNPDQLPKYLHDIKPLVVALHKIPVKEGDTH
jgi:murein DD-endopeptidase MepM/ murein hydrolase activator NlpD